jgi:hypothetical protein
MSIWPTDPPPADLDEPYPWEEDEDEELVDMEDGLGRLVRELDDIERADLDAATRADEALDEDDTDFDGPGWPF